MSFEKLEMILNIGFMLISGIFFIIIGIITIIVSNKMRKEGKKDHKTWLYISIYCFATGALMLVFAALFGLLPAIFSPELYA